jgi:hypothetical protein
MYCDVTHPGYGKILPACAVHLHPTTFEAWFFTLYAGAMVVFFALPWAFRRLFKKHDMLPLLALAAGAITSLGEPMLDHVGHLRWADNLPGPAFSNFGLHIPALIPPCYMLFMGLEAYWIYTMIQHGINKKQFMLLGAAVGLSDAIMEHPGLAMHTYEYYGNQPFKDGLFPFYWSFTNAAAICTIAILIHYLWPIVKGKGWMQYSILLVGIIGTTMAEFGTGFPVFLAINANIATWLQWVIGTCTLILAVAWIRVLAEMVARETDIEWTFWGLFGSRFMFPSARDRWIRRKTGVGLVIPEGPGLTDDGQPAPTGGDEETTGPRVSA